jgi:hypothetical protein
VEAFRSVRRDRLLIFDPSLTFWAWAFVGSLALLTSSDRGLWLSLGGIAGYSLSGSV